MLWFGLSLLWASVAVVAGLLVGHGIRMERGVDCEHRVATGQAAPASPRAGRLVQPMPGGNAGGPSAGSAGEQVERELRSVPDPVPHPSGVRWSRPAAVEATGRV